MGPMRRVCLSVPILLLSLWIGYQIVSIWRSVSLYQADPSKGNLLEAAKLEPRNPEPFYRLGLFHFFDLLETDLDQALSFLAGAIRRNPLEQQYWLYLARVLQRNQEKESAETVLERAVGIAPTNYAGRWQVGNLLLQQGEVEKAIPHFAYIVSHYSDRSGLVFDLFSRAIPDRNFILEKLIPDDIPALSSYLLYLYGTGDDGLARKAWAKREALGYRSDREETLRHVDFLISRGNIGAAFELWKERLVKKSFSSQADGNLVTNGSFEQEKVFGSGFDWRMESVSGAEVSLDATRSSHGNRSLKIVFNGKENLDFYHVYQYVPLQPAVPYLFRADMKTKEVTTKSGLKMEIHAVGSPFYVATEALTGDNDWKELRLAFRAPSGTTGGLVRLRRLKTDKFDRFLGGTVWLDNVWLMAAPQ